MKNGIMIGGAGLTVNENRDGLPNMEIAFSLCGEMLITTGPYPLAIRGEFAEANDWQNAPELGEEPLELAAKLNFPMPKDKPAPTTWWVLARQSGGDGYDTVTLSPTKDLNDAFCTLSVGQWSPQIVTHVQMADGTARQASFRCKLLELSEDAEDFRLLLTSLADTTVYSSPPDVAKEIVSAEGTFAGGGGLRAYAVGWIDLETYVEMAVQQTRWLEDAATTLLQNHDCDMFFMHSHPPDWAYHVMLTDLDPVTSADEALRAKAWDADLRVYEAQDRMIARILELIGKDTLVVLVSDHGATADGPVFDPYEALVPAGLAVAADRPAPETGAEAETSGARLATREGRTPFQPDNARSKAIPQRHIYVYVNLKGRDPKGVVEPEDYQKVQQEIIDALYTWVDPKTGKRPVALALTKKDARLLGLYGNQIGDVVYALYPWFGSQHGQILPTGEWGLGSLKGLLVFNGPGIKKGGRLQRTCGLTDIVPTICYALDLPVPETAEGAVLYQVFKDPNFKLKDIQKLRDGLARMEAALARQEREPWDKHDCA
jgi:hypothetical protein